MKVVSRVLPLRLRPIHPLRSVCDLGSCALDSGLRVEQVRLGAVAIRLRYKDGALLCRNRSPLVPDPSFQCGLLGLRPLEGITIGAVVDLEEELALLHELIVPDAQPHDRAFYLRGKSD